MRTQLLRGFTLGNALVEPLKGQVTGNGAPHSLPPEAVDVLLHLASSPGECIPEQSLLDEVWGRGHGNHQALEQALHALREALGDDHESPRILESCPDGYRLNRDVEPIHFSENGEDSPMLPTAGILAAESPGGWALLWNELRQRRVVRVGIGYLVTAYLVLEGGLTLAESLALPTWTTKLLALLLALGFVITLVVSWLLQVTPSGVHYQPIGSKELKHEIRHLVEVSIIVVLLAVVGVLAYREVWAPPAPGPPEDQASPQLASIAVLPFINLGSNQDDLRLGRGLAEEILHKLVRLKSLKAAARTSSFFYGASGADIPTIARAMQVDYVLEGSVRREGNRFRVTAQLVDVEGFHLWSRTFDVLPGDMLDVQSEVAVDVAREVALSMKPEEIQQLKSHPTESAEAYNFFLEGLALLRVGRSPETLEQAKASFERALSIDPRYARAFAGLCETELASYRISREVQYFENAERACNRALTLDAGQVEVYTALGNLYRSSSQFEQARQQFEHALELDPFYEDANYGLAKSLQGLGLLPQAEELLRLSIELEPGYWGPHQSYGVFLFRLGRYEDAVPHFERVTELVPGNPDGWNNLGAAYYELDDWDSAALAWTHSVELRGTAMAYRNLGTLFYYQGLYAAAADMHRLGEEMSPEDHRIVGRLGAALRFVPGHGQESLEAYRRAARLAVLRLEIDPEDAETLANLAAYYLNIGDESNAETSISRAISLEPESPEVWYFSGIVNSGLGRFDQAISDLARATELGYSLRRLEVDPQFIGLHGMERFEALTQTGVMK